MLTRSTQCYCYIPPLHIKNIHKNSKLFENVTYNGFSSQKLFFANCLPFFISTVIVITNISNFMDFTWPSNPSPTYLRPIYCCLHSDLLRTIYIQHKCKSKWSWQKSPGNETRPLPKGIFKSLKVHTKSFHKTATKFPGRQPKWRLRFHIHCFGYGWKSWSVLSRIYF